MEPSLNLTPQRGPSVWSRNTAPQYWPLALAGLSLVALSRRAASHRGWLAGLGAAAAAYSLMQGPLRTRVELMRVHCRERERATEPLDSTLKDSFPASDPVAAP